MTAPLRERGHQPKVLGRGKFQATLMRGGPRGWWLSLVGTPLVALSLSGQGAPSRPAPPQATPQAPLLLQGVTVVDVETGQSVPAQTVVVVGNRIRTVEPAGRTPVPPGARVVKAEGKFLIPGLWDLHVHPARHTDLAYPLLVANGVTGIRDAGSPVPLDTLLLWRREILAGMRVGPPRQLLSGQSIMNNSSRPCDRGWRQRQGRMQLCVTDAADARHVVDSLKAAGADMIKPRAVSRDIYFVIAAEARQQHIPFGGHNDFETTIEVADSGGVIIDHMGAGGPGGFYESCWSARSATVGQCRPIADRMRQANTWLVPTLAYGGGQEGTYARAIGQRMRQRAAAFWGGALLPGNWLRDSAGSAPESAAPDTAKEAMYIMQQVGLPILAGTDAGGGMDYLPLGFALHEELAMYVAEGLTPLNALQSATLNPARMWHATDSLGTVAPGKLADLVLLDANPLADITNTTTIRAVVANGRYFDRAALDRVLAAVRAAHPKAP